ncbi:MAG: RHS repeat protein [Chitinophagaceae bacterium]|nr:RHS repeat protein [Chitinophagaceae bacterium]
MGSKLAKSNWLLLLFIIVSAVTATAQNLNNPNKRGPLGTQVNTLSGNLFIPRTDIYIPARAFDLDVSFYYNSFLFTEDYGYGKGWTFEYNIRYSHDTMLGGRLILWGDGREDKYDSMPGGIYKTPKGFFNTLAQYEPGKYVLTELDGFKYFFDNPVHKGITRMEEPNGNFINFTYTDTLLTAMTNTAGQSITFTYNAQGRLATVVDAIAIPARTYTYTYDAVGNLKEVKDPLNGKYQYTYLVNGPMKSIADKNNNKVDIIYFPDMSISELIGCNKRLSFSYDTASQKTVVTDHLAAGNQVTTYTYQTVDNLSWITSMSGNCCGFNMKYEYDDQGNQTKMTDANGQVYTYTYDTSGNMLTATDPLNQVSTYTYTTDFKKISSYKDPKGNLYTMSYDTDGNMTQLITPGNNIFTAIYNANGDITSSTDPRGNTYTYNYDSYGNPTNVIGPNGYSAILSFDARGRLLSYTDARGNIATAEYDILDRLKKITDPINNFAQFNYDAQGNIVSYINKNNETSTISYDASNRIVKVTGPTGNQASFAWDGMDNLTGVKNALGHETKMSYDNRNRLKVIKDPENNSAVYSYDGNGNVTSINLPNGRSINYTYDQINRVTSINDATGTIGSYSYDKNNNITSYTNGTGATVTAIYDSLDRIKQITDPLGNSSSYTYDKNNIIITATDREGRISHYTYDSLDRVKTFTDNNGFITTVGYDAASNITSLKDQNNNTTIYTYDSLNRRKTMTYPDGKYMAYTYDKKSNVTSIRLTDATIITYQYDTLNRVTSRTLPGGEVYSYTYDKLNRVLSATNNSGTATFTYDKLNRVTSETFDGRTTRYNYNIAGRTQTTIYPDSTTVIKEFDTRNRLTKILKDSATVVEYAYNNANQLTNKIFANGVSSAMQYDFANRLSSISTLNGTIQNTSFTYDKEMNKTAINRLNNPSLSEQFTYDNGYRLTNYKRGPVGSPVIQNTYTYDAVGNRTAANLNGTATTYSINNLNQLTGVNSTSFTFDDRGNITFDGTFYKTYDAENRLIKDSASPAGVITYGYDALNRRITKAINGNTLKYTYSGAAQIEERDASNSLLNRTVFTNFLSPVLNEKNGNSYYYHQNELNSVEAISNSSGRLIERYQYDAYGKPSRYDSLNNPLASSIAGNRFGFTGQEYDSASGSYLFFFRNYSPETGVFNQRDLIEYQDGMGMYQYVGNNPANGIDVWGLQDCPPAYRREDIAYKTSFINEVLSDTWEKPANMWENSDLNAQAAHSRREADHLWERSNRKRGNHLTSQADLQKMSIEADLSAQRYEKAADVNSARNAKNAKALGNGMNVLDNLVKGEAFASSLVDGQSNEQYTQEIQAGGDLALSALGWTNRGWRCNLVDFIVETTTGKGITTHTADLGQHLGDISVTNGTEIENDAWAYISTIKDKDGNSRGKDWLRTQQRMEERQRRWREKRDCDEGGTKKKGRWVWDLNRHMYVLLPLDPNLIIGPDGQPDKKWVSVKDRMPYTILFENDSTATARTRYIKITTPIEPKQDAATLELGSFGFNNQSFEIPAGTSSYYQRLDTRDSTGLYVDITAGYDVINNQVFWEFQGIDPVTLLPPEDPLAGFLFLQDSTQPDYGNGFVNFSIKPLSSSQTLDTIGARAFIVFDENEVIPTNIHSNTIDAVAPISSLDSLPAITPDTEITLTYNGTDDPNGSGVKWYSIYVADDNGPPELYVSNFTGTDTTFRGVAEHTYKFYVTATDTAGNIELLKLVDSVKVSSGEYSICPNGNVSFDSKMTGTSFQWQVDNGTGFTDVMDGGIYSGATTAVLNLTTAPTTMYGYQYRCLVNGSTYSDVFLLKFGMTWEGTLSTAWENPANWSCNSLPDMNTDVIINGGKTNYPVITSNPTVRTLRLNPGATGTVNTGYQLTIMK